MGLIYIAIFRSTSLQSLDWVFLVSSGVENSSLLLLWVLLGQVSRLMKV